MKFAKFICRHHTWKSFGGIKFRQVVTNEANVNDNFGRFDAGVFSDFTGGKFFLGIIPPNLPLQFSTYGMPCFHRSHKFTKY